MVLFSQLQQILNGEILSMASDSPVTQLVTDSRKAVAMEGTVFFAIKGAHHNGHDYLRAARDRGIRQFVVEISHGSVAELADCNVIRVESSIRALQDLAAWHRASITAPVIAVTGSNGKTIVKEWLYLLLSPEYNIAKNPGSYNSQLGVPLSVWQLQKHHQLGIFEAGISLPGEMERLARVIQPTIGVFTNLGTAHDEGFSSQAQKVEEKLKLFHSASTVIYCAEHHIVRDAVQSRRLPALSWGFSAGDIRISRQDDHYRITHSSVEFSVMLPFRDAASVENAFHCVAVLLHLGYTGPVIRERVSLLRAVPMRLELKEGINQCQILDDTYNNDLGGLTMSLEFLANQQQKKKKAVILSDILESGLSPERMAATVASLISKYRIDSFVGIGPVLSANRKLFSEKASHFYSTTSEFLDNYDTDAFENQLILVKGARVFSFERIVSRLQKKVHGTVMEVDLNAIIHNLNFFRSKLKPSTRIMVMVKAFAYGSGSTEIANVLQYHKTDYLGVAYADEGVELRKNNISLPIMVMNPSRETFITLSAYNLEPEIYSFRILSEYLEYLNGRPAFIHIKIDTGMHRLGFEVDQTDELSRTLQAHPNVRVATIFSHLAASDEAEHDDFSRKQCDVFKKTADQISEALGYRPLYHILNSAGILRLPEAQFDMVRLGIGLYGIDPSEASNKLKPAATLKTIISQLRTVRAGESIGYGRKGNAEKEKKIATIAIGYADGYSRSFSRGVGEVLVKGRRVPVIGNVCMDMTMIDVTGVEVQEGEEVIIFGPGLPIQDVAAKINTIPYEILTSTSERVKRVFVAESI